MMPKSIKINAILMLVPCEGVESGGGVVVEGEQGGSDDGVETSRTNRFLSSSELEWLGLGVPNRTRMEVLVGKMLVDVTRLDVVVCVSELVTGSHFDGNKLL